MDRSQTLDQLEGMAWGEPTYSSSLVIRCHALRRTPVGELTPEDLRLLIGQLVGLNYLVPLALEVLEANPLAEGDYYPSDLLKSVLSVGPAFWADNLDLCSQLDEILATVETLTIMLTEAIAPAVVAYREGVDKPRGRHN